MSGRFPRVAGFAVAAVLSAFCLPGPARAEINLNINIGGPPVVVAEPAEVALIPEFEVYFIPGGDVDLFFHAGFWWSPRGDRWYRAEVHNGPWVVVERRIVPRQVILVPRDYRARYVKAKHIPYGQWKKAHPRKFDNDGRGGGGHGGKKHKKTGKRGHGHDD